MQKREVSLRKIYGWNVRDGNLFNRERYMLSQGNKAILGIRYDKFGGESYTWITNPNGCKQLGTNKYITKGDCRYFSVFGMGLILLGYGWVVSEISDNGDHVTVIFVNGDE